MATTTLPLELTTEILCRLPAKSVARFCSVSKDWASFFSSPYFSRRHCHLRQQNLRLIVRDGSLYSLDLDSLDCALGVDGLIFHDKHSNFIVKKVLGCSNGLLCLSLSSERYWFPVIQEEERLFRTPEYKADIIVICNLSTGAHRIVPRASVDFGPEGFTMDMPYDLERRFSYGFAFDPSCNDYKLIRISQYVYYKPPITRGSQPEMLSEIKVYSMTSNSWTTVDQDLYTYCISYSKEPVLVDGAFHWVAGTLYVRDHRNWHHDRPTSIVAFNLADATFRGVQHLTDELDLLKLNLKFSEGEISEALINPERILKLSLGAVGGRLCVMCSHEYLDDTIVIWKLDGNRSWEPLATFSKGAKQRLRLQDNYIIPQGGVCSNFVLSNNGDKVCVEREHMLICCDLTGEASGVSQIKFITLHTPEQEEKKNS